MNTDLTITPLTESLIPAWDAYVNQSPTGLPQHLSGWQTVLQATYGYQTPYLLARANNRVTGVLPLFFIKSLLTGHSATTMPGGLCADSPAVALSLIRQAQTLAHNAGAARLTLQDTRLAWPAEKLSTQSDHVYRLLDLRPGPEALWKGLDGNIRRQVRIARRNDLQVSIDRAGSSLPDFYNIFSRFTHEAGTPVFSREFLKNVIQTFPHGFSIAMVYHQSRPVGGYFQLELGQTNYGTWGATLREYLDLRPVYLAYWEIMADAARRGFQWLDMGRSPAGTTVAKFKKQWGGRAHPIYQQILTLNDNQTEANLTGRVQTEGKFKWFRRVWPRLPLPVTRFLGPELRRHIPFA